MKKDNNNNMTMEMAAGFRRQGHIYRYVYTYISSMLMKINSQEGQL